MTNPQKYIDWITANEELLNNLRLYESLTRLSRMIQSDTQIIFPAESSIDALAGSQIPQLSRQLLQSYGELLEKAKELPALKNETEFYDLILQFNDSRDKYKSYIPNIKDKENRIELNSTENSLSHFLEVDLALSVAMAQYCLKDISKDKKAYVFALPEHYYEKNMLDLKPQGILQSLITAEMFTVSEIRNIGKNAQAVELMIKNLWNREYRDYVLQQCSTIKGIELNDRSYQQLYDGISEMLHIWKNTDVGQMHELTRLCASRLNIKIALNERYEQRYGGKYFDDPTLFD